MINLNTDIGTYGVMPADGAGRSMRVRGRESVGWRVMGSD